MNEIANANGAAPEDRAIEELRQAVATRRSRINALKDELDALMPEVRRFERALALLLDEAPPAAKPGPKPQPGRSTGIGEGALAEIEAAIREYAADHEEFRQVDIRSRLNITSSKAAVAFEILRQRNVIRLARTAGINKYFRLTREALKAEAVT